MFLVSKLVTSNLRIKNVRVVRHTYAYTLYVVPVWGYCVHVHFQNHASGASKSCTASNIGGLSSAVGVRTGSLCEFFLKGLAQEIRGKELSSFSLLEEGDKRRSQLAMMSSMIKPAGNCYQSALALVQGRNQGADSDPRCLRSDAVGAGLYFLGCHRC